MTSHPTFKRLAHERAVFLALSRVVQERYLTVEGAEAPVQRIECDDLPRGDCQVPEDAVMDVVMRLDRMAAKRARDLNRFKLVPTSEESDEQEWEDAGEEEATGKGSRKEDGATVKQGKNKGGSGAPQAAAAGSSKHKAGSKSGSKSHP